MTHRYMKTLAGRREAQTNDLDLSRSRRNLLLVINDSQPVDYWLSNIKGVTLGDVAHLERWGLIAPVEAPHQQTPEQDWEAALAAIDGADELVVSRALRKLAWPMLRGTRAYRFVQDLEACQDAADLRLIARAFLGQVRGELGIQAVQQVREALTAPADDRVNAMPRPVIEVSQPATFGAARPPLPAPQEGIVLPARAVEADTQTQALPSAEPVTITYRLRRWPSSRALHAPGFARMASLLSARFLSLRQLVELGRVDETQGRQFLAEMRTLALIEELHCEPARTTQSSAVAMLSPGRDRVAIMSLGSPGSASNNALHSNAVSQGLLGRLREHLGLR